MQKPRPTLVRGALGAAMMTALMLSMTPAQAQSGGDENLDRAVASKQAAEIARGGPARWYQEDATDAARLRTLRKEIGAALREAQNACRQVQAPERASCNKEARTIYQQDMAGARATAAGAAR